MQVNKFAIIGLGASLLGFVMNIVEGWASEKELDSIVEEKVNAALAEKEGKS